MSNREIGALTEGVYYILVFLIEPLHGYGIILNVERLSRGRFLFHKRKRVSVLYLCFFIYSRLIYPKNIQLK